MSEIKVKIEDFFGEQIRIIDEEGYEIYSGSSNAVSVANSILEYFEVDVEYELKDLPEQQSAEQVILESENQGGEKSGQTEQTGESVKVSVEYDNEINDGTEDYYNDLEE